MTERLVNSGPVPAAGAGVAGAWPALDRTPAIDCNRLTVGADRPVMQATVNQTGEPAPNRRKPRVDGMEWR